MNLSLRTAFVLSLALAALAAQAQATYSLIYVPTNLNATILATVPATATTTYLSPQVTGTSSGSLVTEATINVAPSGTTFGYSVKAVDPIGNFNLGDNTFPISLLTSSGTSSVFGFTFTSVVTPVPEPSAFAALGLGAVALLKRRKRA